MNRLPDFLLLGTAKAGTSALWLVLKKHPEIFLPNMKEPRFFAIPDGRLPHYGGPEFNDYSVRPTVTTLKRYHALFAQAGDAKAVGEASTVYLYSPDEGIAERIRLSLPRVRLIAILRQPADRAFSNFVHAVDEGYEPELRFEDAWADQERRVRENWSPFLCYRRSGFYAERLRPYLERFDRKQLLILRYEDWRDRPEETLVRVLRFLEVDERYRPKAWPQINRHFLHRSQSVHLWLKHSPSARWIHGLPRPARRIVAGGLNRINRVSPTFRADSRRQVTGTYREDLLRLQERIGMDLSSWMEG